jgi:hypothetical protein
VVRLAVVYETECLTVKNQHEHKLSVAEMRMLRWCVVRLDKIQLEMTTLEKIGVASIVEKMVETRLRWFGHIDRRTVDFVVRRVD